MNRESIMTALFTQLQGAAQFKEASRRVKLVQEVAHFPALFVVSVGNAYLKREIRGIPPKRIIDAQAWIYTDAGRNPEAIPESVLNALLDDIDTAMAPNPVSEVQTLNGQVSHAWIEGEIEIYPGVLDGVAMAIVPIKILVP